MSGPDNRIYFAESQSFRQPWLWILFACTSLLLFGLFGHALYQQLYLGIPWGRNPIGDGPLVTLAILMIAVAVGLPLLAFSMKLTVRVDPSGLKIHFPPFVNRTIPLDRISSWEPCQYRPLRDYGGWGVRLSWVGKGWSYSVSGNLGVRITSTDGKRFLIGSRRPEELAAGLSLAKGIHPG